MSNEKESLKGTFRIGIIPTLAPYLLPRFLNSFTQSNPETKLIIEEIKSEDIIHKLNLDELDIGILATPLHEKNLRE